MLENLQPLLTVTEVARILVCSEANVYALIDRGELPWIQTGLSKGYRIDPTDLDVFLRSRKKRNGSGPKRKALRPRLKHIRIQPG
ncbi:MAG: helix-turn-helix domain-containing protein [Pirellulales bacterium]|nr:helix-turn-helix domain-containing protein [Pirellulales bacterium]